MQPCGPIRAREIFKEECKKNNITGWSFKLNTNKRFRGWCKYGKKRVEISRNLLPLGVDEVRKTIIHELAHVVAGYENSHNHIWKSTVIRMGGDPRRLGKAMKVKGRYIGKCSKCQRVFYRYRRTPGLLTGAFNHFRDGCDGTIRFFDTKEYPYLLNTLTASD